MNDYWIKISETEDGYVKNHHYLISAKDEGEARISAMRFIAHFIDDDENPEIIENGFMFCNKAITVRIESIRETTKEKFKEFLLKTHTIDMK